VGACCGLVWGSLVIIMTRYRLDDQSSIPARDKNFCLPLHDRLWDHLCSFLIGDDLFVVKTAGA
jgi:hypothetical protein